VLPEELAEDYYENEFPTAAMALNGIVDVNIANISRQANANRGDF
jgi:hypothetical protein